MTREQSTIIAIHEAMGWLWWEFENESERWHSLLPPSAEWADKKGVRIPRAAVTHPDLGSCEPVTTSLEAMHKAWFCLPPFYKAQFGAQLALIVREQYLGDFDSLHEALQISEIANATVQQRFEAMGRAINPKLTPPEKGEKV